MLGRTIGAGGAPQVINLRNLAIFVRLTPTSSFSASRRLASISSQQFQRTRKSKLDSRNTTTRTLNLTVNPVPRIRQASLVTKTTTKAVMRGGTPRMPFRRTSQEPLTTDQAISHGTRTTSRRRYGKSTTVIRGPFGIRPERSHLAIRRWLHLGHPPVSASVAFPAPSCSFSFFCSLIRALVNLTKNLVCVASKGTMPLVTV